MEKVSWNKRMNRKPYKQYERISALVGIINRYKMISQESNVQVDCGKIFGN